MMSKVINISMPDDYVDVVLKSNTVCFIDKPEVGNIVNIIDSFNRIYSFEVIEPIKYLGDKIIKTPIANMCYESSVKPLESDGFDLVSNKSNELKECFYNEMLTKGEMGLFKNNISSDTSLEKKFFDDYIDIKSRNSEFRDIINDYISDGNISIPDRKLTFDKSKTINLNSNMQSLLNYKLEDYPDIRKSIYIDVTFYLFRPLLNTKDGVELLNEIDSKLDGKLFLESLFKIVEDYKNSYIDSNKTVYGDILELKVILEEAIGFFSANEIIGLGSAKFTSQYNESTCDTSKLIPFGYSTSFFNALSSYYFKLIEIEKEYGNVNLFEFGSNKKDITIFWLRVLSKMMRDVFGKPYHSLIAKIINLNFKDVEEERYLEQLGKLGEDIKRKYLSGTLSASGIKIEKRNIKYDDISNYTR